MRWGCVLQTVHCRSRGELICSPSMPSGKSSLWLFEASVPLQTFADKDWVPLTLHCPLLGGHAHFCWVLSPWAIAQLNSICRLCLLGQRKAPEYEAFQAQINPFFYSGQSYKWARVIGKIFHLTVQRSPYERCIDGAPCTRMLLASERQEISICWLSFCHKNSLSGQISSAPKHIWFKSFHCKT